MELWYPPTDQPHLLEWWRPLILASRNARLERFPWPIHVDEMVLVGRVDRPARPAIWVYRHGEGRGELYLDSTGQAYRYTRTPNARSHGRFTACEIRAALWRAGFPAVVAPIWFDDPGPRRSAWAAADEPEELEPAELSAPAPRRHGHLTVHEGGGQLAG
jgi:hypothetical protein